MSVSSTIFGKTKSGQTIKEFTLENQNGAKVTLLTYGAIISGIHIPMADGSVRNVVIGYDDLAAYEEDNFYLGSTVGRVANRIANGSFTLGGKTYELAVNNGPNHLHGGLVGFNQKVWEAEIFAENAVKMSVLSKDGDEGYPGDMVINVTFELREDDQLVIEYHATASADTVINLTNHSYFNLDGRSSKSCLDHELKLEAKTFAVADETAIPTGEQREVAGTPFDFSSFKKLGQDIAADDEQIKFGNGYDHHYIMGDFTAKPRLNAEAKSADGQLRMKVYSTMPGFQLYTGNYLGEKFEARQAFCIETQNAPDAINQTVFPSAVLARGERYEQKTVLEFLK